MKKFILIALLCLPLAFSMPSAVFAVGPGGACKQDTDCDDTPTQSYGCYPEGNGTCTPDGDPPAGTGTTPGSTPPAGSGTTGSGQAFVPLSDIPAFGQAGNAPSLPTFLNTLYFYCVGIAVVIAVLQLARAGITYMLADSITSKEEARHLIGASIFGLILVLSPYIIFTLINPDILKLTIDVSSLQTTTGTGTSNTPGSPNGTQQTGTNTGTSQVGAPSGLAQSSGTDTSTTLTWTAPAGNAPTSYQVFDGSTQVAATSATTATLSGLTKGSTHTYTVKSVDSAGVASTASNAQAVTIGGTQGGGTGDGSQGVVAYYEWRDHRNSLCSTGYHCSTACFDYAPTTYPVPYQGKDQTTMLSGCQADLARAKQVALPDQYVDYFPSACTFYPVPQQPPLPAPPAGGSACSPGAQ